MSAGLARQADPAPAMAGDRSDIPGQLPGTATNDNASAGNVGEAISSNIAVGSAVSLTTATPANVTSIPLTAGDWDVEAHCYYNTGGTTTVSAAQCGISTTTASFGTPSVGVGFTQWNVAGANPITGSTPALATGSFRESLAATTTVFLVVSSNFATSTNAAYGTIIARRRR